MRNLLFSVFAIGVAAVAAMTATTAMLNAPHREAPVALSTVDSESPKSGLPSQLTIEGSAQTPPSGETPAPTTSGEAKPDGAAKGEPGAAAEEEGDQDPYEGIAEEELPPDLQYSADSSVSFPTNI